MGGKSMKKITVSLFVFVFLLAVASMTIAGKVPTPTESPEGVIIVSAVKAKEMVDKKEVQVFDMRKALNYGKGHLPGAVSLPYKWTTKGHPSQRTGEFDMSKLPADKNTPIFFYSDGPNGWKSYYASKAAYETGYKSIFWMRDGFATWSEKGYAVEN